MLLLMRLIAIWLVLLAGMAKSSLAESSLSPHEVVPNLLQQARIDDITGDPAWVVVRASRVHPNGQSVPSLLIICDRSRPDHELLAVQDHTLKTDDRHRVEPGFCSALLALAHQYKSAQRR